MQEVAPASLLILSTHKPPLTWKSHMPCTKTQLPGISQQLSRNRAAKVQLFIFLKSNNDLMSVHVPLKVFSLNGFNATANYPSLTFCPASGQQVNSRRLMAPAGGGENKEKSLFVFYFRHAGGYSNENALNDCKV